MSKKLMEDREWQLWNGRGGEAVKNVKGKKLSPRTDQLPF